MIEDLHSLDRAGDLQYYSLTVCSLELMREDLNTWDRAGDIQSYSLTDKFNKSTQ